MAFMTLTLSPSNIISLKPASITSSTALQQANTSASSLSCTGGPLTDKAAITSLLSLRTIAPNLDAFNPMNTAASTLIL